MTSSIRDLTELLAVAPNDYMLISDTSDVTNRDKRISVVNVIGGALTGGGTLATAGFTLTVPATGIAALKTGTPVAGRVASWADANTVNDGGFALSDVARLSVAQTYSAVVTGSGGFRSFILSLNNQTVFDFPLTAQGLLLLTATTGGANTNRYLLAAFRANATPNMTAMSIGSDFNVSTATLTGTTGTAGKATISAVAGHIYIENQLGLAVTFVATLFL